MHGREMPWKAAAVAFHYNREEAASQHMLTYIAAMLLIDSLPQPVPVHP